MVFNPWKITRQMFLSTAEIDSLRAHLALRVSEAPRAEQIAAVVDRVIVESLLFSGLRNSEFCRLTRADVDLGKAAPAFHVRGTPREDRTVYIPRQLAALLREFVAETRPACLPEGIGSRDLSQPLVLNERGRPYERTGLYRRVVRILTDAGLGSRASVQLLRHTYGYLAYLRTGGNLLFVQRQLGHAHPMVTSVYAAFVDESYPGMANSVGSDPAGPADSGRSRASRKLNR
jgi:integrase